jgi:DNA-binding winged helix-turn-helix (wHTH) protein/Tfp pilus assembly protein PilF
LGSSEAAQPTEGSGTIRVGKYRVRLAVREVFCEDRRVQLPWRSFEALQILIEAKGEVVDRVTFFERLWPGVAVGESSLNQCIAKLRRDLEEPPEGGLIETVARRGYRLTEKPELVWPTDGEPADAVAPAPQPKRAVRWRLIACALIAVVVAALGSTYAWSRHSRQVQALSLVNEGFRQVRENRIAGAHAANNLFRQALDLDPTLAPAYAGLAEVMAHSVEPSPGQASAMAERGVGLDPRCAECKAIAGWILMSREWRFREGKRYLDEAAQSEPRNSRILLWHAQLLACSGSLDRALTEIDRARALDFKQPAVMAMRAGILYLSGQYEQAIHAAREALGLKPDQTAAYDWIYRSYLRLGRVEEALAARAALNAVFLGLSPESRFEMESRWVRAYHEGGMRKLVEVLLAGNSSKPALDHQRYERGTWKMWIGDRPGALDELEHVFDFRPFDAIYVGVDPMFAPLHGEPRFRELLSRMGLDTVTGPQ